MPRAADGQEFRGPFNNPQQHRFQKNQHQKPLNLSKNQQKTPAIALIITQRMPLSKIPKQRNYFDKKSDLSIYGILYTIDC
jgi:hypothetical protein